MMIAPPVSGGVFSFGQAPLSDRVQAG